MWRKNFSTSMFQCGGGVLAWELGGHTIPKGASCFVKTYFLHIDVNVFPDPEKFDPDRFSPENSTKIPECAYTLFSVGPRNCIVIGSDS
ncbi:UNVERIFIED_CONTAM: Cyp4v2 [Trichonephila clavipes]